jgi:tellurite resistance protein
MSRLVVTREIAEQFIGALLVVMRADQEIEPEEAAAMQRVVAELLQPPEEIDLADVMLRRVTPDSFAAAVARTLGAPYRGTPVATPDQLATAFLNAARHVAGNDGDLTPAEAAAVGRFVDALRT